MVLKPKRKSFSKFCLRAVSLFLLIAMACQDLAYANPEIKLVLPEWTVQPLRLDLPTSVAKIEDAWQAPCVIARSPQATKQSMLTPIAQIASPASAEGRIHRYSGGKSGGLAMTHNADTLVYLIQDAHTNPSAQINIAKTLELLIEKEKISTVYLEGGFGDVSLNDFKSKADLGKRKQVGMHYLRQGELSGAEYLNLTSQTDFTLEGVEDETLYWKSLEVYRSIAKERDKFKEYLSKIRRTTEELKPEKLNPLLRTFDSIHEKFLDGKISWTDYFAELEKRVEWFGIVFGKYPQLKRLKELRKKE